MRLGQVVNADAARWGKPLDGIRVLALEQMQALPFATQLLGRLGAEVVKVEAPGTGDLGRSATPAMADPDGRPVGATFVRNNLSKRSVVVDLKHPAGRDLVLRMAARFDVVAENFRAGAAERLGLGYDDVAAAHPSVVYLSISGFGRPVHDRHCPLPLRRLARAGLHRRGDERGLRVQAPGRPAAGRLADGRARRHRHRAVRRDRHPGRPAPARRRTGRPQRVDVAMLDAMVAVLDVVPNFWSMGMPMGTPWPGILHGFRAADGWFMLQVLRAHQWPDLARAIGRPEWADDPRFATPQGWLDHLDSDIRPAIEPGRPRGPSARPATCSMRPGWSPGPWPPTPRSWPTRTWPHATCSSSTRAPTASTQPVLIPGLPVKFADVAEGPETAGALVGRAHRRGPVAPSSGSGRDELAHAARRRRHRLTRCGRP